MDYDFSCGADDKCTIKLADGQEFHGFRDGKTFKKMPENLSLQK